MLIDKNGNKVTEGCYIKLTGCSVKNDNGIYIVETDYNTHENVVKYDEYLLEKVNIDGTKSKAKYRLYFLDGINPQKKEKDIDFEVVTLENLKKARKEVTEYLKKRKASEVIYTFSEAEVKAVEELKKGMVVKITKPLLLRGHINSFRGSYIVEETENGIFRLHLLGEKGSEISSNFNYYTMKESYYQGRPVTLYFRNEIMQQLFDENYIIIQERNKTTKGQLEKENQNIKENLEKEEIKQEAIENTVEEKEELKEKENTEEISKTGREYCTINENMVRTANMVNSFREYKPGSATEEYKHYRDKAYDILDKIKKEKPEQAEQVEKKVDYYCKKLAKYYNDYYRNEASCPSIMICGASNFPVKKKERQNNRRETLYNTWKYLESYLEKIENILTNDQPIKSGDSDAIEKLTEKIKNLEEEHKMHMECNRYYKKNGTLKGFEGLEEKKVLEIENFVKKNPMFPPFITYNETANIRRYKERLAELIKEKETGTTKQVETDAENNKLFTMIENKEIMRLQIVFDGIPPVSVRDILKSNGFRWSPKNKAWQRQLTNNTRYIYKNIKDKLKSAIVE